MINICARRAKTATGAAYRRTEKVPYLPVYCALFCPYLHKDKATKQATDFGLLWERLFYKYLQTYLCAVYVARPTC